MAIRMNCPSCRVQVALDASLEGKTAHCNECGASFVVRRPVAGRAQDSPEQDDGIQEGNRPPGRTGIPSRGDAGVRPRASRQRWEVDPAEEDDLWQIRQPRPVASTPWIVVVLVV